MKIKIDGKIMNLFQIEVFIKKYLFLNKTKKSYRYQN